jgi:phage terminase large subunit-like protein
MSYVERAIEYAKAAQGSDTHGKWSQLACQRFLDDLKRAEQDECPFYFSEWHATDVCEFVEKMPHIEGTWESRELTLYDAQVFFLVNVFGFRNKSDDKRRFTNALWASGRKNGKSTLAAPIGLYCQFEEGENGAQVISAAPTGKQARIVFDYAKNMVNKEPEFREFHQAECYANSIAGFGNSSSFKPVNSKADTLDGLNPYCVIIDEVHAHKDNHLIAVLKSAIGARLSPLFLYVTTEGYLKADSPWPEIRMYIQQILSGAREADNFFGVIFSIDDNDDEFDETKWIKANPIIEVNPNMLKTIAEDALEAQAMPSKMAEFRIKRLNRPSAAAEAHIDLRKFEENKTVLPLDELEGYPCWLSLDLSATRDLTSLRMLWLVGDEYHTHGWRFLPENGIHQQTASGGDIYAGWKEQGLIIETKGKTVNHAVIIDKIVELCHRFNPVSVGSDPWNATEVMRVLKDDHDIQVEPFRQGAQSYHPAIKKFDETYYSGNLYHGCDPILTWCAGNLVMRHDQNMNQSPDKKNSANKIDDIVTLLMCFGMSLEYEPNMTFDDVMTNRISMTL